MLQQHRSFVTLNPKTTYSGRKIIMRSNYTREAAVRLALASRGAPRIATNSTMPQSRTLRHGECGVAVFGSPKFPVQICMRGRLSWLLTPHREDSRVEVWGALSGPKAVCCLRTSFPFDTSREIEVLAPYAIRHLEAFASLLVPFITLGNDILLPLGPLWPKSVDARK